MRHASACGSSAWSKETEVTLVSYHITSTQSLGKAPAERATSGRYKLHVRGGRKGNRTGWVRKNMGGSPQIHLRCLDKIS